MRILHVVPTYYPAVRYGGPIRSVHGLCAALAALGHDVHVYTTTVDGERDLSVQVDRPVSMDGVWVHYFRVPTLRRLYWSPAMAARLKESMATFDVAHLHSVYLWPTWAAARAAQRAGIPYLMAPRGMLVGELIRHKSRWVKLAWINLIERRSLAYAAGVHVTAPLEGQDIKALGFALPAVYCVPNGVDLPDDYPSLQSGPFANIARGYALFLGRLAWKKGLDRLIQAWKWVPDMPLIIGGNDEEGYRREMEALADREGVRDRIFFIGPVSDEHKWALYKNAEVFVLPSYSENFGNVVAEAMAVGCPVIVSSSVGLASTVQECGAGVVVTGEPQALAAAVCSLHGQSELRSSMAAAGRRTIADQLSWPAIGRQMEEVYRAVAATSPSCPPSRASHA